MENVGNKFSVRYEKSWTRLDCGFHLCWKKFAKIYIDIGFIRWPAIKHREDLKLSGYYDLRDITL